MNAHNIPLSELPAIQPGCFLVLHGEQGAGKSVLARRIAATRGKFAEIMSHQLGDTAALSDALSDLPATLIIEAEVLLHRELAHLKTLVTSTHLQFRAPYSNQLVKIPVPPVIVCSQEVSKFSDMRRAQLFLVRKACPHRSNIHE